MNIEILRKRSPLPPELPEVYRIVDGLDRRMREAFLTAIANIKDDHSLNRLARAFEQGGISRAINEFGDLDPYFQTTLVPELERAVQESGRLAVTTTLKGALETPMVFSMVNPLTADEVRKHGAALVREIADSTRAGIEEAARIATITGRSPRATAQQIRGYIGLTESQTKAVENFRTQLLNQESALLNRKLRDKRFDATLRRLIDGQEVSSQKIEAMVDAYQRKYLRYRSEVIGRTESMRGVSMGDFEAGRQAEDAGVLKPDYKRFWIDTKDERERDTHRQIPGMNKEGRAFSDKFLTPLGPLRYPRDPEGTARNTIQCRCHTVLRRAKSFLRS